MSTWRIITLYEHQAIMKNKKRKGFISADAPMYSNEDFLDYFEERVSMIVRQELELMFKDLFYKY